jgi:hypothetical protein
MLRRPVRHSAEITTSMNDNTLPACDVTNNQEAVERQLAKLGL